MSFRALRTNQNVRPLQLLEEPTVTTQAVTNITGTSGDGNGTLINTGGSPVTARGFVYSSVTTNPTLADSVAVEGGTSTGTFTKTLTSLSSSTTYYIRAYATNAIGTGYGDAVSFTTTSVVFTPSPYLMMMGVGS